MTNSDWHIVKETADKIFIVDEDLGNMSVTNDAENVVRYLLKTQSNVHKKIIYRDSLGDWSELKHDGTKFVDFGYYTGEPGHH